MLVGSTTRKPRYKRPQFHFSLTEALVSLPEKKTRDVNAVVPDISAKMPKVSNVDKRLEQITEICQL